MPYIIVATLNSLALILPRSPPTSCSPWSPHSSKYDRSLSHCFLSNLLTAVFDILLSRTSYPTRTLFSFPSRHFITSTRHWKLGRWSFETTPGLSLTSMHPCHLLLGPTLSSLSLAARVSSSQCFNGNFQSSTRRPGSSDSHPQHFSFLSRRQSPAPFFPAPF